MGIKSKLKEIRMKEYMLNCREFSKMLEVPLSTYSQWENSQTYPSLPKAFEVCKKLNKKVNEVWYEI